MERIGSLCTAILVALLAASAASGGEERKKALEPRDVHGFKRIGDDARYLVMKPFHLDRRGKIRAAVVAGTTVLLYAMRDDIRDFAQDHSDEGRSRLYRNARIMGKGSFAPAVALVSYLSSFATDNPRERQTSVLVLESMGFSAAAAGLGDFVLATERPEDGDAIRLFHTGGHGVSLDAALAGSVIGPLHRQYLTVHQGDGPWRKTWKRTALGLLYAGATLTAYQRVDADKHWAPDAFLGMMSGIGVGYTLCEAHEERQRQRRIGVALEPGPGGAEIRLRIALGRRAK